MVKVVQINVGGFDNNFSYLVLGEEKEAILIDATGNLKTIEKAIFEHKAKLILALFTHSHPDHCELLPHFESIGVKCFMPKARPLAVTKNLRVAGIEIKVIHTPGHTKESVCFLIEKNLFTGDTLFVRGVGTTAYGGNDTELEESLAFLSTLDKKLLLWPGHDYGGASSTLKEALNNSHLKPSEKILELIKDKVKAYESKKGKNKF